jgi:hypothetical protein
MARPQIRQGQLITTFGPGAMTDLGLTWGTVGV